MAFTYLLENTRKENFMTTIIGYEPEKKRIEAIADVLKNYEKYQAKGVAIPKGLILSGPAGVGKTLFAKYLAELSSSEFFSFSPSIGENAEFENAHKIKLLFEEASKKTPSIVFVDELDSYLPDPYFNSDKKSDFLATILKALDGDGYSGILFIATCIHAKSLPHQVIRSGRADEHIVLEMPDIKTRKLIIDFYLSKVDIKINFDTKALAYKTQSFVGADLKNLINMTARVAINSNKSQLTIDDFLESIYTIRFKDIKRGNNDNELFDIAIHEIGHLVVGKVLLKRSADITIDNYDYVKGLTISNDSDDEDEDEDKVSHIDQESKKYYLKLISTALAGKATEDLFFGYSSDGCSSDIVKAVQIIEHIFESGICGFKYLDFSRSNDRSEWSNKQRRIVEKATIKLLNKCYKNAKKVIRKNRYLVIELSNLLVEKTVLVAEESNKLFAKYGL